MFGIGPMEMGIIAVVALLIFGPEKLPEMMGQAGKMVRDFRKMTAEMSGEFEKTIAEAKTVTKDFQGELGAMSKQVNTVSKSVQKDLGVNKASGSKATTSTKRSSSTSSAKKKSGSSTASSSSRKTAASKSTSSSTSTSTAEKTTSAAKKTAPKPAAPQVATREDPTAAVSLFEPSAPRRERRERKATVAAFGDATPRHAQPVEAESVLASDPNGQGGATATIDPDDPLARARQRRQSAGYARKIS